MKMNMKKFYIFLFFSINCICANGQDWIKTAIWQNGIWYPWNEGSNTVRSGYWDYFSVHSSSYDASHFYFRLKIDDFTIPPKKVRKEHIKTGKWYEYSGYIEYWIDDEHMDFLSVINSSVLKVVPIETVPWHKYDNTPSIIKRSPAKILIQPYNKTPVVYNVFFEGIGYSFYFFNKWGY